MENYHLWYVRRGSQLQGPFPDALIYRYIILGRIGHKDELSQDGQEWYRLHQLPQLLEGTRDLTVGKDGVGADDVYWQEERAKAALRWLDDRKSPDQRGFDVDDELLDAQNRRASSERRLVPETVERHVYRENRALYDASNGAGPQHYGWAAAFVLLVALLALAAALFMQPVRPLTVGLHISPEDCNKVAGRDVNWSGCNKEGELLIGADLRGAQLLGTRLKHARLRYADLSQANLARADLTGADLTGARLGNAIWIDGRTCAVNSVGVCR